MADSPASGLLGDTALLRSDTVANAAMNRDRGWEGVNSYARDLGFPILAHLQACVARDGSALWFDACCGTGRALFEAHAVLQTLDWGERVTLVGADLWPDFPHPAAPNLRFLATDVVRFTPDIAADLVTCVHGLHYLGDKLAFLQNAAAVLRPGGVFVGHLDPVNLCLPVGWTVPKLTKAARTPGFSVSFRKRILRLQRQDAEAALSFPIRYAGAVAPGTVNFSGMTGVDSVYVESEAG